MDAATTMVFVAVVGARFLLPLAIPYYPLWPPDWSWKFRPEPLPEEIDEPEEQAAWRMRYDAILSTGTLEKVMLVGLVAVIFSQMLPDFTGSTTDVFIGVAAVVVVNSGITLAAARRRWTIRSTALAFAARLAMNVGLVLVADPLLGRHNARLDGYDTIFFLTLISLSPRCTTAGGPVHEVREVLARGEPAPELEVDRTDGVDRRPALLLSGVGADQPGRRNGPVDSLTGTVSRPGAP